MVKMANPSEEIHLVNHEEIELTRQSEATCPTTFEYHGMQRPIDFVLAAETSTTMNIEINKQRNCFFANLKKKRVKKSPAILSQDGRITFWLIYAPFDVLCDTAEDVSLRLPTVPNDILVTAWYDKFLNQLLTWWETIDPFKVKRSFFQKPKSFFADTFDKSRLQEFHNGKNKAKLFTQTERSRLVSFILESTCFTDDTALVGKTQLINMSVFSAAYPVHDGPLLTNKIDKAVNTRQKLSIEWASFKQIFKYQPIDAIKEYFGVKIAFYYSWLGFYTCYLLPASIFGVLCFIYGALSIIWFEPIKEICSPRNASIYYMCPLCDKLCSYYYLKDFSCLYAKITHLFDNDATAVFAVFMSVWSVFYLEYWRRTQWTLAYDWNTIGYYEEEVVRPQYTAIAKRLKRNPVTGKMEPYMSRKEQFFKICGTASVVLFFVTLVIAALIGVIVYRAAIFGILLSHGNGSLKRNSKIFVTSTAAIINLLVINILKVLYNRLAIILTEWENPRTRSDYEKSFTVKMFWFQFCNTYASVFYVAFFKSELFTGWPGHYRRFGSNNEYRLEGCSVQGCFLELCVQLVILMGGQQLLGNFVEIFWPLIKKKYSKWKHGISSNTSVWEADYQLSNQEEFSLFWEYQEVVIQYGFVTMFVAAFPLAPLIALITNLVEMRIDAINMIESFRRPVAYKSEGIGVWFDIMVTLTAVGVLINGFVLSLTSEFIPRLVYKYQFSADGSLKGYVDWSLSYFKVTDFLAEERPEIPTLYVKKEHEYCRFPGFHTGSSPYSFNVIHWEIMTVRLIFAFLFQWMVSCVARILAWIIPDKPRHLKLKLKRQEYIAKIALQKFKIKTGKRKPDLEGSLSEDSNNENQTSVRKRKGALSESIKRHRNNSNNSRKSRNSKKKKMPSKISVVEPNPIQSLNDEVVVATKKDSIDSVSYLPYPSTSYTGQML